ncbi:ParB/RepB/Spo0J family partition protein [Comamonas sp.]|uniref:ParB/RepB/Spo0J family partition protein n=1 Tax=Comamonas sp. TaxID=34028 RepID=UPI003A8F0566
MTDAHDTITANLPTPGAGERMAHVTITSIARSLTNPRKRFDPTKLQELADSIAASGVHQPILIRPLPGHRLEDTHREARALKQPAPEYELVAGERRWRACQLAKVAQIPAMIRPMTDAQALEVQIIENLQREDVTELEEAEGYRTLMDSQGISLEQVAQKIGKSKSYVHTRVKILDLCQEGQQALRDGLIDFSAALPVARIPNEQLQIKALEEILTRSSMNGSRMSARAAQDLVRHSYMLKLEYAQFDREDANLCPAAGTCSSCTHRTGANPDMFTDVESADVCTNPPCYRDKEEAHAANVRKQAEQLGAEVIDGREAKALVTSSFSNRVEGYLRLDSKDDSPIKGKTLRTALAELMEQAGVQATIIVNPHNNKDLIPVLRPEQARELLAMAGAKEAEAKLAEEAERTAKLNEESAKAQLKTDYEIAWRQGTLAAIVQHLQAPSQAAQDCITLMAAHNIVNTINTAHAQTLCKLMDLGKVAPVAAIKEQAEASPISTAGAVIALRDSAYSPWWDERNPDTKPNEQLQALAAACGIDIEGIKAQAKANQRAVKQAQATKAAAPKPDLPQHPAARAGGGVGRGKAKKSQTPAAHAGEVPKTSAAHASALIAAALQEADSGAAAAAQGNDAAPVADAQAPITGADAQCDEAAPVAAAAAHGLPHSATADGDDQDNDPSAQQPADAQAATANDGQDSADVNTGPAMAIGRRVRVNESANGKKQKPWVDHFGTVEAQLGPEAWDVAIERAPRCKPLRVAFHTTELEIAT